jgi:hypothetical protein
VHRTVPTTIQPAVIPAGLRAHLLQPWGNDTRSRWGDRGRHVAGQDRTHHRCFAPRALPVQASAADLYPEKEWKKRPLGLPSWSDKLVDEVVRLLLEAYYEPRFSDRSHGFRPGRGCHTALREVANTWAGTTWFIEGDISDCFGSLDHSILLGTLGEKIHDNRFLRLLGNMLQAGYLEDWQWNATHSGAPQGGIVSPLLSNIYLHRLDTFVETVLIPEYTRGKQRNPNPAYQRMAKAVERARNRDDLTAARALRKQQRSLPSKGE